MNIIIPVGGLGTRLRPLTWSRPKPLVSVAGKPLLGHVLDALQPLNIERVVFITGFLGEQIEAFVKDNYSFDAVFVRQEQPLGQSHAIAQAAGQISGPTIIIFPDMIFNADLTTLENSEWDGAILVKQVDDPRRFGVVELDGERITRLVEKPETPVSDLAVVGIYYVREVERLFEAIDTQMREQRALKGEYYLADALQMLMDDGQNFTAITTNVWEDCGTPPALLHTNRYLLAQFEAPTDIPGSVIIPPAFVAPTAKITGSVIGPNASIGDNVVVDRAIIRDSIVDVGAIIEGAMLNESIIGRDALVRGEPMRVNVGDSSNIDLSAQGDNGRG